MSQDHPPIAHLRNVSVRRIIRALEQEVFNSLSARAVSASIAILIVGAW